MEDGCSVSTFSQYALTGFSLPSLRHNNHSFLVPKCVALHCFHLHLLKVGIAISTSSCPTALDLLGSKSPGTADRGSSFSVLLQVTCCGAVVPGFQPLLRHQQATQESLGTAGTVADSTLTSFNSLRRWEHPTQETDASLAAKSRRA